MGFGAKIQTYSLFTVGRLALFCNWNSSSGHEDFEFVQSPCCLLTVDINSSASKRYLVQSLYLKVKEFSLSSQAQIDPSTKFNVCLDFFHHTLYLFLTAIFAARPNFVLGACISEIYMEHFLAWRLIACNSESIPPQQFWPYCFNILLRSSTIQK